MPKSLLISPDEKVSKFTSTLQSSVYDGVSGDNCKALIGSASTSNNFATLSSVQGLDSAKVKSLSDKFAFGL